MYLTVSEWVYDSFASTLFLPYFSILYPKYYVYLIECIVRIHSNECDVFTTLENHHFDDPFNHFISFESMVFSSIIYWRLKINIQRGISGCSCSSTPFIDTLSFYLYSIRNKILLNNSSTSFNDLNTDKM